MPWHFLAEIFRGRLFGHPIHVMLIHFPSALFPMSVILDILGLILHKTSFAEAAFYAITGGLFGGFVAAIFGAIDYFRLPSEHSAWKKASLHGLLNFTWLMIFTALFALRMKQYPDFQLATLPQMILSALTVAGLLFSNYLGGELVLRYKLGILEENEFNKN